MNSTISLGRVKLAVILIVILAFMIANADLAHAQNEGDPVVRSHQGFITDENGQPVGGATIQIATYSYERGFHLVASAVTDEDGYYTIPSYTRYLGEAVTVILNIQEFVVVNEFQAQPEVFDYQLPEQRTVLTGKVTYTDTYETPIEGYPLRLKVYLGGRVGYIDVATAVSDRDGNYRFSLAGGHFFSARGTNTYSMFHNNGYEMTSYRLDPGDHRTADQRVSDMAPPQYLNGVIEGQIIDEAGSPIHNAEVEIIGEDVALQYTGSVFDTGVIRGGLHHIRVTAPGYLPQEESIYVNGRLYPLQFELIHNDPPIVQAHADRAPDRNGWYNEDVTVSFTASDDDSELEIDPPVLVATEGANQVISGSATDSGGMTGTGSITINIDKTAPSTEAAVSGNVHNDWYSSDVHVALLSSDSLSGVEYTEYSLDQGSTWLPYNEAITIASEGENKLLYRSMDRAGNTELPKTLDVNIDKTRPTLELALNQYKLSPANHKMIPIHVSVDSVDIGSGIEKIVLSSITYNESNKAKNEKKPKKRLADIQNADYGTNDTSFELRAEASKKNAIREYIITYTATDRAGNVATASAVVTVTNGKKDDDDDRDDDDD
ncbi:carboxypeptidase-like regulatory domain-containing protein [Paenibacillus sp. J5C_2022]|uniref:carboxypeptidase-like regulatory domain-containing protein n=1 Tax=Paenibacillus sp. J5C2022 TaxID=2977129 RepID=UPI0021D26935|nr:carboxypeptidase-like regulatory domain-containing protein [Paenibacillus sp. J5C2022]MCU6709056.1 carboxypeptidase-like regulatory domain-containing protein [Paenibacillus sp. J5C2022]